MRVSGNPTPKDLHTMTITHIQATGTERPINQLLSPLTVFTGPNGTGKSTRLNIIRTALIGHMPEYGKLPSATIGLAAEPVLHIAAKFSDGQTVERVFTETAKGASCENRQLPEFLKRDMLMLNPGEYFKMTAGDQIKYIFANMKVPASCTVEGIMEELLIVEDETDRKSIQHILEDNGVSDGLVKLTNSKTGYVPLRYTYLNKRVQDTIGAVRTLTELKHQSTGPNESTSQTIAHWNKEMARAQADIERGNKISGELVAQERQAQATQQRREHLQSVLAMPALDVSKELERLDISKVELNLNRDQSQDGVDLVKHRAKYNEVVTNQKLAQQEYSALNAQHGKVADDTAELSALECCPHCKSKGKGWKANLEAMLSEKALELNGKMMETAEAIEKLEASKVKLCKQGVEIKESQEASASIRTKIAAIDAEIKDITQRIETDKARRKQFQDELDNLPTVTAADTAELQYTLNQIEASKAELEQLTGKRDAAVRLNRDLQSAEEAHQEHLAAQKQFETIKAYKTALEAKQASLITDLFKGLLADANYFTRGILKGDLDYHKGEIGYWNKGSFVSATIGNTEQHIIFLAVSAALAKDDPIRIALLDKLDVDDDNWPKIMRRLREAVVEGRLDQVVIACTSVPEVNGWEVMRLEREVLA